MNRARGRRVVDGLAKNLEGTFVLRFGVDEVDTKCKGAATDRDGLRFWNPPKLIGSEADDGQVKTGTAEPPVLHSRMWKGF
jgi:hypothetical protein